MARSQDIERETKRQSKHEGDEDGLWLQLDVYQKPDTSKDAEDAVPVPAPMFDGVEDDTPSPPAAPAAQTKLFLGMSSSTWATSVGLSVAILLIGLVCEPSNAGLARISFLSEFLDQPCLFAVIL